LTVRNLVLLAIVSAASVLAQPEPVFRRLPASGPAPSPRIDGAIAYDQGARRIFLFGGQDSSALDDLWMYSLDRQAWTPLSPAGPRPPARFGHTLIFDPVRRRAILFGGQAGGFFSDVWSYEPEANTWRRLAPDNAGPSKRYGHSAVYDATRERMIISHGFTDAGRFDDTWAFDLRTGQWRDISPPGVRPLRRCLHHAVIDETGGRMLLYGGCSSGFGPCPQGDLWSFDLTAHRWTERPASPAPPAREWFGIGFDGRRGRLVVFGGNGAAGILADTWEWEPASGRWTQLNPTGERPAGRLRQESAAAPDLGGVVFFGGRTDAGLSNELWLLAPPAMAGPRISSGGIRNAFSGQGGAVAPGELVSIFGAGLGPEAGVASSLDSAGALPLSAAGVTVSFNGIPAPVLFVRFDQVNVQAPPELSGRDSAGVLVTYRGVESAVESIRVAPAHPGFFAGVFNQDGSVNSPANPAAPGSMAVLFATGTAPAQPSLRIDGRQARLHFAGPIPGTVGLIQINAEIPAEAQPGGCVDAILTSAGMDSPPAQVCL
jgi:uncharacterized protein (TIGR03437 family)